MRISRANMQPLYAVFHHLSASVADIAFRGETFGREVIPTTGGYLVAANHASHFDPFIIGCRLPHQAAFFARKTLWKPGFIAWWLDAVGVIPVDRDGGSDVAAVKRVLSALRQRKTVIMFPEGTRSPNGELQSPKPGVGFFACRTQVPVIPARVFGAFAAFPKDRGVRFGSSISVAFGQPLLPIHYDEPSSGKDRYRIASERIMSEISKLTLPPRNMV